jgi:hypothetical protein
MKAAKLFATIGRIRSDSLEIAPNRSLNWFVTGQHCLIHRAKLA